jgi:L-iditol 2-dehydrogenase
LEEGALLEPLSVGVHACRRAGVGIGTTVLVTGAGPIGLVSMLVAKAMGASKVIVVDLVDNRLEVAKKLGADFVIKASTDMDTATLVQKVKQSLGGDLADVTIECSGAEASIKLAIQGTRAGGVVLLVGLGPANVTVPIVDAAVREVDIRGVFRYANCYPLALDLIATGKVDVKPLITHHFKLEETLQAFETSRTGAGGAIKVMIHC